MSKTIEIGKDVYVLPFCADTSGDVRDSSADNTYIVYQDNAVFAPDEELGQYIATALNYYAEREEQEAELKELKAKISRIQRIAADFYIGDDSDEFVAGQKEAWCAASAILEGKDD